MDQVNVLLLVLAGLVMYVIIFKVGIESIENVSVRNPFTDVHCVGDGIQTNSNGNIITNLPIITFSGGNQISCLSTDGSNCLMKNDLTESNIPCWSQGANVGVNYYLTTRSVRESNSNSSLKGAAMYNLLNNNGYSTLTCTPDTLNTPGHWCNTVLNEAKSSCSKGVLERDYKIGVFNNAVCDPVNGSLIKYTTVSDGTGLKVTPYQGQASMKAANIVANTNVVNALAAGQSIPQGSIDNCIKTKCTNTYLIRNKSRGVTKDSCNTNCINCGQVKC